MSMGGGFRKISGILLIFLDIDRQVIDDEFVAGFLCAVQRNRFRNTVSLCNVRVPSSVSIALNIAT